MTDGIVDTGDTSRDLEKSRWMRDELSADAADNGIKVFGIAFTEAADFQLIQSISQQTKGEYFRALVAEDLKNVFQQITDAIDKVSELPISTETEQISTDVQLNNPSVSEISDLSEKNNESIVTIEPRIEAVEKALDNLEEPIPFPSILIIALLALFLLTFALLFLVTQRKGLSKVKLDEPFQEAYLNDLQGKTDKEAHILDERPKMIGRVAAKDAEYMD